jgi:Domain of Unknown Function (DUF1206)
MTTDRAQQVAAETSDSRWAQVVGRFGLFARGVVYIVLGALAVDVAVGHHNRQLDRRGTLSAVANRPFGRFLLIVLTAGFFAYAFWQALSAISGRRHGAGRPAKAGERLVAAGKALVYGALGVSTIVLLVGSSGSEGDTQGQAWTARLMKAPLGRPLVFLVGTVVVIVGLVLAWRGVQRQFDVDLPERTGVGEAIAILGVIGTVARGVVIGLIGIFLVQSAITFDPHKAKGLDATLKSLAAEPHGSVLLSLVAVGLISFGVFNVAAARYARF